MKVKVRWYRGNGDYDGTQYGTLAQIESRLSDAHCVFHAGIHGKQASNPKLLRVLRLATGEVARVYNRDYDPNAEQIHTP